MHWFRTHRIELAILGLALLLRLPLLHGSFWLDEAAQALEVARPFSQQLSIAEDFQPPFLHLWLFLPMRVSQAEWWLRLWGALLPGLVSIWFTMQIARNQFDKRVAWIAGLLLATSSFHVFFSQELRPYALPTMWAAISWWALLKIPVLNEVKGNIWWLYTFSNLFGLYSSYLYPFLLISQAVFGLWCCKKHLKPLLVSWTISAAGFAIWLPWFLEQLSVGTSVREQLPGWEAVVSITQIKSLALVGAKFIFGVVNIDPNAWYLGWGLVLSISLTMLYKTYKGFSGRKIKNIYKSLQPLIIWLMVPLVTAWLVSFVVPVVRPKRVLFLLPAGYLLTAVATTTDQKSKKRLKPTLTLALPATLLVINFAGLAQYYFNQHYQRENWRSLHTYIQATYPVEKTIAVFSFPEPFAPWRWYDQGLYATYSTGKLAIKDVPSLSEDIKVVTNYSYVLVFDYLRDLTDPEDILRQELWSMGFKEIHTIDYPNIGFVRVYTQQTPVAQSVSL